MSWALTHCLTLQCWPRSARRLFQGQHTSGLRRLSLEVKRPSLVGKDAVGGKTVKRSNRLYTTAEDEVIMQDRRAACKWAAIASKLGRSVASVKYRYWHTLNDKPAHGVQHNAGKLFTKEDDETILAWMTSSQNRPLALLRKSLGRSYTSLRHRVSELRRCGGVSPHAVKTRLDALGRRIGRPFELSERLTAVYLKTQHMPWRKIIEHLPGRSLSSVGRSYIRHGWHDQYKDFVATDPRRWGHRKMSRVAKEENDRRGQRSKDDRPPKHHMRTPPSDNT